MNKVNINNGSLSLTGLHAKTAGELCCEVLHKLSPATLCAGVTPATIYATNIGINWHRRQFIPGDNLCRYTCLLSIAISAKGAEVVECLSCGARGPGSIPGLAT